jgi:uncharacterized metal-binding protein YceD (DUF177 family)
MSRTDRRPEPPPHTAPAPPWSVPVKRAEIPETGRHFDLVPDAAVREALARLAGVVALPRLAASFDVTLQGRGGLRVVGRMIATVTQTCVVTAEPVENTVEEPIDLAFMPTAVSARLGPAGNEIEVPVEDEPEALIDDTVDLATIATEFLVLAIDPYPRKPGAVFEPPAMPDAPAHPFAGLAALKGGLRKKDNGEG